MIKSIMYFAGGLIVGFLSISTPADAGNYSISGIITGIGCQTINGICFVTLNGTAAGPPGCVSTDVRWDSSNTPNGTAAIAQLTAAFIAGTNVYINISNACFSEFPNYPTMDFYSLGS